MSPPPAPTITNVDSDGIPPYTQLTIPLGKNPGRIQHILPGFMLSQSEDGAAAHKSLPLRYFGSPMISEKPYSPDHPRSLSMNCAVDGEAATHIKFVIDQRLPNVFKDMPELGSGLVAQSGPFALYHSHVLWGYATRMKRVEGGKFAIWIVNVGSHLGADSMLNQDDEDNDPPGQLEPPVTSAYIALADANGMQREIVDLKRFEDGFLAVKHFTKEELSVDDSLVVRVCLVVERAYFNLSTIIDLQPKHRPATRAAVEGILCGERPPGWDFAFTNVWPDERGDAGTNIFFAHKAPFERISAVLKNGFARQTNSGQTNVVHAPQLSNEALKLAIRIGYNVDVPLPTGPNGDLFRSLYPWFKGPCESVLVAQWEREICARALALDTSSPSATSIADLLRLLNLIWDYRYGNFPVGKRVVIGVLADMMHRSAFPTVFDFVQNTILPCFHASGMRPEYLPDVLGALTKHIRGVAVASKTGVVMGSA